MTEMHEMRVPFAEATRIAIACQNCKAEIVIDLKDNKQSSRFVLEDGPVTRFACPCCTSEFDSSIRYAVTHLRRAFAELKKSGQTFSFCVSSLGR